MGDVQGSSVLVVNYRRRILSGAIIWGNCPRWKLSRGTLVLGGNCPGGKFPNWQLSRGQLSRGGFVLFPNYTCIIRCIKIYLKLLYICSCFRNKKTGEAC